MPRRIVQTAAAQLAARPAPQFIVDEEFQQPERIQFGRETVYNPAAVRQRIVQVIKSSSLYAFPMDQYAGNTEQRERDLESFMAETSFGSYSLRIERSWGVGGDLSVRQRYVFDSRSDMTEGEDRYRVAYCTFEPQVNWSSTGRSIASAQASVALYQELINLGALVASVVESFEGKIASVVKMIPNPAYVTPEVAV